MDGTWPLLLIVAFSPSFWGVGWTSSWTSWMSAGLMAGTASSVLKINTCFAVLFYPGCFGYSVAGFEVVFLLGQFGDGQYKGESACWGNTSDAEGSLEAFLGQRRNECPSSGRPR
jgi:hypothetical protein